MCHLTKATACVVICLLTLPALYAQGVGGGGGGGALAITTDSLSDAYEGTNYGSDVGASGGQKPYTWSFTADMSLPWLRLVTSGNSGKFAGTVSIPSGYSLPFIGNVTVTCTDDDGAVAQRTFTILVREYFDIITENIPSGRVGVPYSVTLEADGGVAPYSWGENTPGLWLTTTGLALDPSGRISGIPTRGGRFADDRFRIHVTDGSDPSGRRERTFDLVIHDALEFVGLPLPHTIEGNPYDQALSAQGGVGDLTLDVAGLPQGIMFLDGKIQGIAAAGSARGEPYPVTLSVTDSATPPFTVERVVDFFVYERLDVSPPDFHAAIEGASYTSDSHTVEYGTSPFRFEIDNLPIGLAIEQTTPTAFRLIGVPEVRTASNSAYHLVLNVTDSSIPAQQMSVDFDFFVRGRLRTLTAALPAGVEGWAYSPIVLQATGGLRPYTWQAANLPAGLVLQQDEASLEWTLTGTPTVGTNGVHALRLSVSDSDPDGFQTATTLVALSIAAGDDETPPLSLATTFLPRGTVGEDYPSTSIVATGGDGTYIWSVRGLPPGLQHSISTNTILLSGTPETSGEFFVDVTLADGSGDAISTIYPLIVSESIAPPPQQLPPTVDSQIADVLAGAAAAGCSLAGNNISGIALLACFYLCCVARQLFLRRAQFIDTKL